MIYSSGKIKEQFYYLEWFHSISALFSCDMYRRIYTIILLIAKHSVEGQKYTTYRWHRKQNISIDDK